MKITLGPGYRVEVRYDLCHCTLHLCVERFESVTKEVDEATGNVEATYQRLIELGCTEFQAELPAGVPKVNYPDEDTREIHDVAEADLRSWLQDRYGKHLRRSYDPDQLEDPVIKAEFDAILDDRVNGLVTGIVDRQASQSQYIGGGVSVGVTAGGTLVIGFG